VQTLCLMLLAIHAPAAEADVLVVCPPVLRPAMTTWIEHRTRQGHRVTLAESFDQANDVRSEIRQVAKQGKLRHVLLVGDADPAAASDARIRARGVPTKQIEAKVNIHWGSEKEIASDNWFADLDDDDVPDVTIGRLTADTPAQLKAIVNKIIAYEEARDFGDWRRRVNLIAGVGGFGALADRVLETATKKLIVEGVPNAYQTTMTYASWRSPLCPDPRAFHQTTLNRLNEGCLLWVYIGHGHRHGLDQMHAEGRRYHIFDQRDVAKLDSSSNNSPIACLLACYTGAYDQPEDCLAEHMLRAKGGPVAVLAGSRVTMPYAMSVLSLAMMDEMFSKRRATLGEVFMRAKQSLASSDSKNETRKMLDVIAAAISPKPVDLAAERREHLYLFNLLGDPLLRLPHGRDIQITAPKTATAGQPLLIQGTSPVNGRAQIELVVARDRLTFNPQVREQFEDDHAALEKFTPIYNRANDQQLAQQVVEIRDGQFRTTLDIPPTAHGKCHVRVYVEGRKQHALGAVDIDIER
jgi:hypothetical protein